MCAVSLMDILCVYTNRLTQAPCKANKFNDLFMLSGALLVAFKCDGKDLNVELLTNEHDQSKPHATQRDNNNKEKKKQIKGKHKTEAAFRHRLMRCQQEAEKSWLTAIICKPSYEGLSNNL